MQILVLLAIRKQGFAERVKRSYSDHVFAGHAFFRSIADQGGPILMDKELAQLCLKPPQS